jgi:hypothetical protein
MIIIHDMSNQVEMLKIGPALGRQSMSKAEGRKRLPEAFADQAYLTAPYVAPQHEIMHTID